METLATQATLPKMEPSCIIGHVLYIGEWQKRGGLGTTLWPKQSILLPRLCRPKSFQDQPLLSRTSQRVIDIFIFSSQEDLFAKSTFFPASIFTQKCGTDPVAHHHYPPMTPAERKPLLKRIRFLYYARTHLFVIVIYFYCNPPPFSPCPARKIVYKNKLFLFSTLILRPALKNNLKNCSQLRSFCKRRDMPLP